MNNFFNVFIFNPYRRDRDKFFLGVGIIGFLIFRLIVSSFDFVNHRFYENLYRKDVGVINFIDDQEREFSIDSNKKLFFRYCKSCEIKIGDRVEITHVNEWIIFLSIKRNSILPVSLILNGEPIFRRDMSKNKILGSDIFSFNLSLVSIFLISFFYRKFCKSLLK